MHELVRTLSLPDTEAICRADIHKAVARIAWEMLLFEPYSERPLTWAVGGSLSLEPGLVLLVNNSYYTANQLCAFMVDESYVYKTCFEAVTDLIFMNVEIFFLHRHLCTKYLGDDFPVRKLEKWKFHLAHLLLSLTDKLILKWVIECLYHKTTIWWYNCVVLFIMVICVLDGC